MTNFNQKTVAVSALIFITVVAPTLTFGAVYGTNTENHIGAVETILSTAWVGIFLSLFSGMPVVSLIILLQQEANPIQDNDKCTSSKIAVVSFLFRASRDLQDQFSL